LRYRQTRQARQGSGNTIEKPVHDESARPEHCIDAIESGRFFIEGSHCGRGVHHGRSGEVATGVFQNQGFRASHIHTQIVTTGADRQRHVRKADAIEPLHALHLARLCQAFEGRREGGIGAKHGCIARVARAMQPYGVAIGHKPRQVGDAGRRLHVASRAGAGIGIEARQRADSALGKKPPVNPLRRTQHSHVDDGQPRQIIHGIPDGKAGHDCAAASVA